MTSRQARTERRAAERTAKKLAAKSSPLQPVQPASAADRIGFVPQNNSVPPPVAEIGFVPQNQSIPALPVAEIGFVPQNGAAPAFSPKIGFVPPSLRAAANRQNAQLSTGPRTPAGKLASSRNSTKHGLASGQLIVPGEDPTQYQALLNDLLQEHQPAGPTEELLVAEIAQSYWLTQRALRLQNDCFTPDGDVDAPRLALFMRYQTTHQRAFHKALTALIQLKKQRAKNERLTPNQPHSARGFVSQNRPAAASVPALGFVSHPPAETFQHHPNQL